MLQTKEVIKMNFRGYEIEIPAGTSTTHQTALGIDEKYNFINDFSWISKDLPLLKMDAQNYGINIAPELLEDIYSKPGQYLKGLSIPFKYEGGVIVDGAGKEVIKANRNSLETPLGPAGRDAILHLTCVLLNEAFEYDKAAQILRKLGY